MNPDNPLAFPNDEADGMTLRDYFAGKAISALELDEWKDNPKAAAEQAYEFADAMLKARETKP